MSDRRYKDLNLYSCIVLNLLASALEIDLAQRDLEQKLDMLLSGSRAFLTKSDILHEIRSNHNMTERILSHLLAQGFIEVSQSERSYSVKPTKAGLLHVREFNRFYATIYAKQIEQHYKFTGLPAWYRSLRDR